MNENADNLRNQLFQKYFDDNYGIKLSILMEKLKYIIDTWKNLHNILESSSEDINKYTRIELIEKIAHNNKEYLIIKFLPWSYLIIDLNEKKVLNNDEIENTFTEEFFIQNFNEQPIKEGTNSISIYWFYSFNGEANTLINYYIEHEDVFNLTKNILYKIYINEAWTYLAINLSNGNVQLGFQTKDQILYERLFLNDDLKPYMLQDAHSKIGKEKMKEMFRRIKDIIIPFDRIPDDLLKFLKNEEELILRLNKKSID